MIEYLEKCPMIFTDKPTVYFDVDNTLVFSKTEQGPTDGMMSLGDVEIGGRYWVPHQKHVELIKDFKARGHNVVVWSAGGAAWAASVVWALNLNSYVDLIISKPSWYFDDLPSSQWLGPEKRYYKDL